ncbi:MAG: hypothetical protein ACT443_13835 [Gemmatimonadota bacterium]
MRDPCAGCSLASTIHANDVRKWRSENPEGVAGACVNTSAVKYEVAVPRKSAKHARLAIHRMLTIA